MEIEINPLPVEDTIETPEGPEVGETELANQIIKMINAEWDTIKDYNNLIKLIGNAHPEFIDVINDINNEENKHVGQLQTILKTISPNAFSIESGEFEGATQLFDEGLDPDDDDDDEEDSKDQNDEDAEEAVTTSGEMIKGYFSKDHKEFTTVDGISYHVNDGGEVVTESLDDDDYFIEIEDDYEVAPGVHFIEDGQEYQYVRRIDDQYIDFDHWAVWECKSVDDESADSVYFIVEEDTGFIDWGPEESREAAIDFLNSKLDDFEDEEDGVYEL